MQSATITFKAKAQTIRNSDGSIAYKYVPIPELARRHCDMSAFRNHAKFGAYANSDLFPGMLARIRKDLIGGGLGIRLDRIPENVKVAESEFLTTVTVTL